MAYIDYAFNIKPHGIPKLMKYLKLQKLNKISNKPSMNDGTVSLEQLDLYAYAIGGLRLHKDSQGCWYQFYINFESYRLTGLADFENAERILRNVRIIPEKNRISEDNKVYVGMGGIYSQL